MLLAVNYHYISREPRPGRRGIVPIAVADLAAQLDELGRSFEFISRGDLVAAVEERRSLPDRACLITFDDGLREQVELALPLLEERGIPAIFFVSGQPLEEPRALYVHKVHQLRETMSDDELTIELDARLASKGIEVEPFSPAQAQAAYRYDTSEAASLKYLLNVVLGPWRPEPIDRIFAERFSEAQICESLYLTPEHVVELEAADALGAHTYTHLPLARLDAPAARNDLERGAEVLRRITGLRPRALSYPYGTAAAVNVAVAREAAKSGFAFGLTLERAFNRTLDDPLLLARVDANDAPGGREPLFSVNGTGITVHGNMTRARARYLDEIAA